MTLKEIAGQDQVIDFFVNTIHNQRLGHAYLFLGPDGVGKTLLARNLAKFLNCQTPVKKNGIILDCCEVCPTCDKINKLNHPDVFWINPNKSRKISIDEIRLLQKEIYLKPYESSFKIFIISQADCLTEEAANGLLKTLEEPPESSLLILTSAHISGLLTTIVSRCQMVKFNLIAAEKLKKVLSERYQIQDKDAHFLAAQAQGRIGVALNLKQQDSLHQKNHLIEQIVQAVRGKSVFFELFDLKDRENLTRQITFLLNWFRDILVLQTGLDSSYIINADREQMLKEQAQYFDNQRLERIIAVIERAHRLIGQSVNPKIALEVMARQIRQLTAEKKDARSSISKN